MTGPEVTFVIDEGMISSPMHEGLPDALRAKGFVVDLDTFIGRQDRSGSHGRQPVSYPSERCVVTFGSIGFVEERQEVVKGVPGCYYDRDRYQCSRYRQKIPLELLGNADAIYMPFGEFERSVERWIRFFGASRLFVRPDSGRKPFTGTCMSVESAGHEIASLKQLTSVTERTMVLIAPAVEISAEYRFFIVDRKVITGSRYHVNGEISIDPSISPACLAVAERIAQLPKQIDLAYSCDVGIFNGKPRVVEINAFSTSGLYACDSEKLFVAIAHLAWREFNHEVYLED